MTTTTVIPSTTRSNTAGSLRGGRTALVTLVVGAATAAAVFLGGGTASAQSGVNVVGMSERDAHATLRASNVPFQTMVRIGGAEPCIVTGQSDLGNNVIGRTDSDGDRTETVVWKGLGLSVRCA